MNDGHFLFPVIPHEGRTFSHHLDVGPFPPEFFFSSALGPFMRANEKLGRSGEVFDLFESKVVNLTRVIFQVQDDGAYSLGINDPTNAIDLCINLFF